MSFFAPDRQWTDLIDQDHLVGAPDFDPITLAQSGTCRLWGDALAVDEHPVGAAQIHDNVCPRDRIEIDPRVKTRDRVVEELQIVGLVPADAQRPGLEQHDVVYPERARQRAQMSDVEEWPRVYGGAVEQSRRKSCWPTIWIRESSLGNIRRWASATRLLGP